MSPVPAVDQNPPIEVPASPAPLAAGWQRGRRLVLASASPRRSELLGKLGVAFSVAVAEVQEHEEPTSDPVETVRHNAALKAAAVAAQAQGHVLVIGADTVVAIDGVVLHKPADFGEARAMLRRLSGRTHEVFTGVCLHEAPGGPVETAHHRSAVTFHPLDDAVIDQYFALVNPLDKAGAYGIQTGRELIVARVEGSVANVMGLPIEWLAQRLISWPKQEAEA